jgi:hypothetical protein
MKKHEWVQDKMDQYFFWKCKGCGFTKIEIIKLIGGVERYKTADLDDDDCEIRQRMSKIKAFL